HRASLRQPRSVDPGEKACRRRFRVALDPRDLACKKKSRPLARLQCGRQDPGGVDVAVPVDLTEAYELRAGEPGNGREDPLLLRPPELRLEPDHRVVLGGEVVLAELDDGVRTLSGPRVLESYGLHGPESQGVDPAPRHLLDRQAPLEERRPIELVKGGLFT